MEPMEKRKAVCYTELAYVLGILTLALGTALMERADVGLSMVVAPAYLMHLKLSEYYAFVTFGVAEYLLQALLLLLLGLVVRRFKLSYLFSFVTAVIYGYTLDLMMLLVGMLPGEGILSRCVYFVIGMLLCEVGVAFMFHTYLSPEAYELFVKEISGRYGIRIDVVKTVYDMASCLTAVVLSFLFYGWLVFRGVGVGTVICALVNGYIIGRIGALMERHIEFRDALRWRRHFEGREEEAG